MNKNKLVWTGLSLALLVCGCATTPQPNEALESARAAVQAAEADPNVPKYAALDLDAAKKQPANADAAVAHHEQPEAAQAAYLAAQTARLAQLRASAKADDARVAAGQAERDKILLTQRAREADAAKANAARLQAEIDALKAQPTDRGLVLTLGDVLFATGKAQLTSGRGPSRSSSWRNF